MRSWLGLIVVVAGLMGIAMGECRAQTPPPVRISQVNGIGGSSANDPNADYVELVNVGSTPVDLTGWAVQLSRTQQPWTVVPLSGVIQPERYFLVRLEAPRPSGTTLPTPDVLEPSGAISPLQTDGKVALTTTVTPLVGRPECPFSSTIVDFVGYGVENLSVTTDQRMPCGVAVAPLANAQAALGSPRLVPHRGCGGGQYSFNNLSDFVLLPPRPRNSSTVRETEFPLTFTAQVPVAEPPIGVPFRVRARPMSCGVSIVSVRVNLVSIGGGESVDMALDLNGWYETTVILSPTVAPGPKTFTITVTDSLTRTATKNVSIVARPAIPPNDTCEVGMSDPNFALQLDTPVSGNIYSAGTDFVTQQVACGIGIRRGVWYSFTPTESRFYSFTSCGSSTTPNQLPNTVLAVFEPTDCQTLKLVSSACGASIGGFRCGNVNTVTVSNVYLRAGLQYAIALGGDVNSGTMPGYALRVTLGNARGESCLNDRINVNMFAQIGSAETNTSIMPAPLDTPAPNCWVGLNPSRDVWFMVRNTYPGAAMYRIDTCGSEIDTVLAVYTECGLQPVACNDDGGECASTGGSSVDVQALVSSQELYVRVAAKSASSPGGIVKINARALMPPGNDNCENARDVASFRDYGTNTTFAALSLDPALPMLCDSVPSRDVFYLYYTLVGGPHRVTVDSRGRPVTIQMMDGCGAGTSALPCGQLAADCPAGMTCAVFDLARNTDYVIRVAEDGSGATGGPLATSIVPYTVNSVCERAFDLTLGQPFEQQTASSYIFVTNHPRCWDSRSLESFGVVEQYYRFVAPTTGVYRLSICSRPLLGSFSTMFGIATYPSCPVSEENRLVCGLLAYADCQTSPAQEITDISLNAGEQRIFRFNATSAAQAINRLTITQDVGGACCRGSTCVISTASACVGTAARFIGVGAACNPPGNNTAPCCRADFNQSGGLSINDIFDFINGFFLRDARTDFDRNGQSEIQDIFNFLNAWFVGC